jgi:hypothetical protein
MLSQGALEYNNNRIKIRFKGKVKDGNAKPMGVELVSVSVLVLEPVLVLWPELKEPLTYFIYFDLMF